jgi:NADH-quinone oxidoreductase subunit M
MSQLPLLSLLIWLPIIGGLALLLLKDKQQIRLSALAVSVATFVLSLGLYTGFDSNTHQMQFVEQASWIPSFNINYHLGVDGFSMPLMILTTFSTVLVVAAAWDVIQHRVSQYMAAFLVMEGLMLAVFSALDAILFYVFFEAMLIPLFLVIGIWGGPNRVYATIKFFLYTFFGSVFLLLALLYLHFQTDSFAIIDFHTQSLSMTEQTW